MTDSPPFFPRPGDGSKQEHVLPVLRDNIWVWRWRRLRGHRRNPRTLVDDGRTFLINDQHQPTMLQWPLGISRVV